MQALRQYHTVQGNTAVLRLPEDFSATEIEVIILPSNGASGESSEKKCFPRTIHQRMAQQQ
jgi:hypothetical protein